MVNRLHLLAGAGLVALCTLTSCGGGGGSSGGNHNDPPSSTAYSITPGEYETTARITEANLSAFPQDVQDGIRQAQQRPMTQRGCMPITFSVEEITYRNLRFSIPEMGGGPTGGCNLAEISLNGGKFTGSASCQLRNLPSRPGQPTAVDLTASLDGTYEGGNATMNIRADVTIPGENKTGNVAMEITTRRVGDCPARPAYTPPPVSSYAPPPTSSYGTANNSMATPYSPPPMSNSTYSSNSAY